MTLSERDAGQARADALVLALRRETRSDTDPAWRRLERWATWTRRDTIE
jgi:hypothetical protein